MSLATKPTLPNQYPYIFPSHLILCVDEIIKRAWIDITENSDLKTQDEEEITSVLQEKLIKILHEPNEGGLFNTQIFQHVSRGEKYKNYNGVKIEKAPDLTVRVHNTTPGLTDPHYYALFIECKIIDTDKYPALYIKQGIKRFIDGDYAWRMQNSMMLAYVKNNATLPQTLKQSFIRNSSNVEITNCKPKNDEFTPLNTSVPQTWLTKHTRHWEHSDFGAPGDIEISHIWLNL